MEDLVESILDYVRADYTDYAIMINGEWGSGKTYFWNNKIRNKIDSLQLNGKQYTTIYMSLYGISNLDRNHSINGQEYEKIYECNRTAIYSRICKNWIRYGKSFWSYSKWR